MSAACRGLRMRDHLGGDVHAEDRSGTRSHGEPRDVSLTAAKVKDVRTFKWMERVDHLGTCREIAKEDLLAARPIARLSVVEIFCFGRFRHGFGPLRRAGFGQRALPVNQELDFLLVSHGSATQTA